MNRRNLLAAALGLPFAAAAPAAARTIALPDGVYGHGTVLWMGGPNVGRHYEIDMRGDAICGVKRVWDNGTLVWEAPT